jgi:hypothetical protein
VAARGGIFNYRFPGVTARVDRSRFRFSEVPDRLSPACAGSPGNRELKMGALPRFPGNRELRKATRMRFPGNRELKIGALPRFSGNRNVPMVTRAGSPGNRAGVLLTPLPATREER